MSSTIDRTPFRFDDILVKPERNALIIGERVLSLESKIMDVLCVLAEHAGEVVPRDILIDRVWGVKFGADESLTRAISLLRKTLVDAGADGLAIETIRKRGYLLSGTVSRDVAENPREKEHPTEVLDTTITPNTGSAKTSSWSARSLALMLGSLLVIALLIWQMAAPNKDISEVAKDLEPEFKDSAEPATGGSGAEQDISLASIAVLPFDDFSAEGDQEYFSDGISEELLNLLAKTPGLHVTSRSSAFAFKDKDVNIPEVARILGVTHILEGSVRKSGNQIRISAQLIEAESDKHLWSETYDRELDDIFAVQDEISAAIVLVLRDMLGVEGADAVPPLVAQTADQETYQTFLKGNALLLQETPASVQAAKAAFEKVIALDPNYAPGHSGLAGAILDILYDGPLDNPDKAALEEAEALLVKALTLDPNHAPSFRRRGDLRRLEERFEDAIADYEKSLSINPNDAITYTRLALLYNTNFGDSLKSQAMVTKAYELDPLNILWAGNYALTKLRQGDLEAAEQVARALLTRSLEWGYVRLSHVAYERGDTALVADYMLKGIEAAPESKEFSFAMAHSLASEGFEEAAVSLDPASAPTHYRTASNQTAAFKLSEGKLKDNPESTGARIDMATSHIQNKDWPAAKALLEQLYSDRDGHLDINNLVNLANVQKNVDGAIDEKVVESINERMSGLENRFDGLAQVEKARVLMLFEDADAAIDLLTKAAGKGVINVLYLRTVALEFEAALDDPRMKAAFGATNKFNADVTRAYLERFCTDPIKGFWAPSAETCAKAAEKYDLIFDEIGT